MKKIQIGFVKTFNTDKKFGFIRTFQGKDIFFHISNANEKNFKKGDIVGYTRKDLDGKYKAEAVEIKLAENYTEEFKMERGFFCSNEWGMIRKGNAFLFWEPIKYDLNGKDVLLEKIDNHIDSTDITILLDSYNVKVISGGRNKPGDDDTAWVDIESGWLPIHNSIRTNDYKHDFYIQQLFPKVNKSIYYERAFSSWRTMIEEYKEDKTNWEKLEHEAIQIEVDIKNNAKIKYNKVEHKKILKEYLEEEIKRVLQRHENVIKSYCDYWKYDEIISGNN